MDGAGLREQIRGARRVVIKIGTRLLVSRSGRPSEKRMGELVDDIAGLVREGKEVVVVSSGAIGCGIDYLGWKSRPQALPDLQMAAAVGQTRLMALYGKMFAKRKLRIGQVLLTHDDLRDRRRHLNARNTMLNLLRTGIVGIVNENDVVSVDEINFGDNDGLAALVCMLVDADALVILTTVSGLYRPLRAGKKERVSFVKSVTKDVVSYVQAKGSELSVGGMLTKLEAAKMVTNAGIQCVIADGRKEGILRAVFDGSDVGTIFRRRKRESSVIRHRKQWIAFFNRAGGALVVDDGASAALEKRGKSLLAIGITDVKGSFDAGVLVNVMDRSGRLVAKGLVEFSSSELAQIKGKKNSEIAEILGARHFDEVIHRDNMTVLAMEEGDSI